MILVTGGAGFIGSNVVASLNEAGRSDVAVCDVLGSDGKWRNLQKRLIADMVAPGDLPRWLEGRKLDAVIHLGAISDTTATDGDAVMDNNFRLSLQTARLVHRDAHAVHLRILCCDVWRWRAGLLRRVDVRSAGAVQADESLRLEQASV